MTSAERPKSGRHRSARLASALRAIPNVATYSGIALLIAGGVLLAVAWGRVAGLTNVALQVPYVISAACVGLALIAVGLTVLSITAKVSDARARRAQMSELRDALRAIRQELQERR